MSQCKDIKAHLLAGYSLTSLEALQRFGCSRLAARIYDLREEGVQIGQRTVKTSSGKHVAQYYPIRYQHPFQLEPSP